METAAINEMLNGINEMIFGVVKMRKDSPDDLILWRLHEGLLNLKRRLENEQQQSKK